MDDVEIVDFERAKVVVTDFWALVVRRAAWIDIVEKCNEAANDGRENESAGNFCLMESSHRLG